LKRAAAKSGDLRRSVTRPVPQFLLPTAVSDWHEQIVIPTIAMAILDRLVHNATDRNARESMRKRTPIATGRKGGMNPKPVSVDV